MNSAQYQSAMNTISPSEALIRSTLEAASARPDRAVRPYRAIALGAAALCLAAVLVVSLFAQPGRNNLWSLPVASSEGSGPVDVESPSDPTVAQYASGELESSGASVSSEASMASFGPAGEVSGAPEVEPPTQSHGVNLWGLNINELSESASADMLYYPEESYDTVEWSYNQFINHWGRVIRPSALPDDLYEDQPDHGAEVILTKAGQPAYDAYHFTYAESFDEQYDPLRRSVTLSVSASSVGVARDVVYLVDQPLMSDVRGVEVMFGHCAMDYGPYDPETHAPAGTYDLYVAEFSWEGIDYQLTTNNLTLEEAERVLLSLLEPEV